jgi:exodeoxyribonuclease-3
MRILTLNCNGIRSAARKGLFDWLPLQSPDVICLQETRAQVHQLEGGGFRPDGYHCYYFDAERKGYSGVAAFSKAKPDRVIRGIGVPEFDVEGRYLELQFGRLSVVSIYLPSGSSGPERQASKFRFLEVFLPYLKRLGRRKRQYVLCGDFNIGLARPAVRRTGMGRRISRSRPPARAIHLVVQSRPGAGQECRLAN